MELEIGTPCKYIDETYGTLLGNLVKIDGGEFGQVYTFSTPHGTKVHMGSVIASLKLLPLDDEEVEQLAKYHVDFAKQKSGN